MKKIITLTLILLSTKLILGQTIYYDALFLEKAINNKSQLNISEIEQLKTILKRYNINEESLESNKFIDSSLLDINFKVAFNKTKKNSSQNESNILNQDFPENTVPKAISSIGGLDVTTIADGFAKFIVKRTKQELSIAFFEKFRDEIRIYPDLQTVFPQTYQLLDAIDNEIYNFSNYINNLREAFNVDIKTLDEHLPGIIANHPDVFKDNFEITISLKSACYVSNSLRNNMHIGDVLDGYPLTFFDDLSDTSKLKIPLKGSIQLLQLFSESFKEIETSKHTYWVGIDKIRQLVNDKDALKIYFGLVLQVAKNKYDMIPITKNNNIVELLTKASESFNHDYMAYKQYLLKFGGEVNEINKIVIDYENPKSDSIAIEQYSKYFKTSIQFIQQCVNFTELPFIKNFISDSIPVLKNLSKNTERYFKVGVETSDLTVSIYRKKYPEAINHLITIYKEIAIKPEISNGVVEGLSKYGSFIANMVNSENSDQVGRAIEDAALPTGSARIKRESKFNVALNAYCGLYTGFEYIDGIDKSLFHKVNSYGVSAPIGISISRGHSVGFFGTGKRGWKENKLGWSSSIFLSVFDIGALTSFRFNSSNDSVQSVPNIELKDIISPGIFLSTGIAKTPLSINLGWQMGPLLRQVDFKENKYFDQSYHRISISLVVDLPLLNLYNKTK